jgi:hypothetical protein
MDIRTKSPFLAVLCVFLLFGQPVAAASKTANDLLDQCQISSNLAIIACHIYVHAVQDVLATNPVKGYRVCIPPNLDIDQSVSLIVDWLKQHPEESQQPASDAVAHALWSSYHCK